MLGDFEASSITAASFWLGPRKSEPVKYYQGIRVTINHASQLTFALPLAKNAIAIRAADWNRQAIRKHYKGGRGGTLLLKCRVNIQLTEKWSRPRTLLSADEETCVDKI